VQRLGQVLGQRGDGGSDVGGAGAQGLGGRIERAQGSGHPQVRGREAFEVEIR
jgi:hypothetical protein